MNVIRTCYSTVDDRGYIQYHSQKSYEAVEQQVKAVLDTVQSEGVSAGELIEWIASYQKDGGLIQDPGSAFPKGELRASTHRGRCEGWMIELLIREEGSSAYRLAMAVKFISDPDLVFECGKALSMAVDEGLYGYEPPPGWVPTQEDAA